MLWYLFRLHETVRANVHLSLFILVLNNFLIYGFMCFLKQPLFPILTVSHEDAKLSRRHDVITW